VAVPEETPPPRGKIIETKGLIIVAVLTLIFLIVRYWHQISWSAR
jgi:hypothetical protein